MRHDLFSPDRKENDSDDDREVEPGVGIASEPTPRFVRQVSHVLGGQFVLVEVRPPRLMTSPQEIRRLKKAAAKRRSVPSDMPSPRVPDGIVQFATDPEFLGCDLFPRQGTLLKLMTQDTANFTDFDS